MTTTSLAVQTILQAGTTSSLTSANAGGHTFVNDGHTFLMVTNGDASPMTVTIVVAQSTVNAPGFGNLTVSNDVITVAAGATKLIGSLPRTKYNDSTGKVTVSFSSVTSLTVGAFSLTKESDA